MKKIIIVALTFLFTVASISYAKVILKIRAINPLNTIAVAPIDYPLPKEITPDDVIDHKLVFGSDRTESDIPNISEFQILLNQDDELYYIKQDIELLPKEVVTLEVSVKDAWVIDESNIKAVKEQLNEIVNDIEKDSKLTTDIIIKLKDEITEEIGNIIKHQEINSVNAVGINKHIEAYRQNLNVLEQVFLDISMLKNLIKDKQKEGSKIEGK